ncbi:hypothetical protein [Rhizosphaericola mali]|uniref:Uncharacterized protein n=1 Tax=Rhizosphaericola mali TaxID=2545455 RepID=A0A5P2FZ72_9BACT|nr:hypothetical protein [Rhizosphaericola mali]QES88826.1 hypothetical protein E0W69_009230 [Rhizosphaericola mali]
MKKLSKLYTMWANMKSRCNCPRRPDFKHYGGKGITVCSEFMDFKQFELWAKTHGYKEGLSIERIDNSKDYEPSNCKFIPIRDQSKNRTTNVRLEFNGQIKNLSDWAREFKIHERTIRSRLDAGFTISEALTMTKNRSIKSEVFYYQGKEYTKASLAKELNVSKTTIGRLFKQNLTIDKIFSKLKVA